MAISPDEPIPVREPRPVREGPGAAAALALPVVFFGVLGVIALVVGLLVGMGKNDGATSNSAPVEVSLAYPTIAPAVVNATTTGGIHVVNKDAMQHNLAVQGTNVRTAMLDGGKDATLDLSSLQPGDYTLLCEVPGHQQAGMTAKLHLTAGSTSGVAMSGMDMTSSGSATQTTMSPEQMDQAMQQSMAAFPAQTAGLGAQDLAPTVLPDGTKQFELTTAVTKWEVSPGKFVEAKTYNGTVPGPTLHVNPGDKVRIILHNHMDESTSIHFHGIETPNSMDGTTFVTQDPVKPGADFTYEFTAQSTPAVGMYHSHHIAYQQVPDGLTGAFIIGSEPVPAGVQVTQEHVMVLGDSGVIGFALNGKSFPATAPIVATQGEWVEVHYMNEGTMIHPMHLHGMGQLVIAKDGFPLANPEMEDTVTVAPGERYTVLVHATEVGTWVWHCHILPHAENENGMFGMVTALVVKP